MRKILCSSLAVIMLFVALTFAFPLDAEAASTNAIMNSMIPNSPTEEGARLVDETVTSNGTDIINTKRYELPDGTEVVDTLTLHRNPATRSPNGTGSATRTREVGTLGTITLTASFK